MSAASELSRLAGAGYPFALAERGRIAGLALAARNASTGAAPRGDGRRGGPFASDRDYLADLAGRTICLTLLAGSGSRWIKSLAAARERGGGPEFDPGRPRGLYPVRDFLGSATPAAKGAAPVARISVGAIPIAAYAFAATLGLGRRVIVVRGWEAEIEEGILAPLGILPGETSFFTQEAPFGKPLGHGDAAWQCRSLLSGADYVVANFGGDANSRRTIASSLMALDALRSLGESVDLMLPAARIDSPAYPIRFDVSGLPRGFGHAKLQGAMAGADGAAARGDGYTNVGVRVYSAPALVAELERFRARYWIEGEGYSIPGNDPAGHEFALDNVDAHLASEGRARILAIARPQELTPAKSVDDIPAFEAAIESVVAEDRA